MSLKTTEVDGRKDQTLKRLQTIIAFIMKSTEDKMTKPTYDKDKTQDTKALGAQSFYPTTKVLGFIFFKKESYQYGNSITQQYLLNIY